MWVRPRERTKFFAAFALCALTAFAAQVAISDCCSCNMREPAVPIVHGEDSIGVERVGNPENMERVEFFVKARATERLDACKHEKPVFVVIPQSAEVR